MTTKTVLLRAVPAGALWYGGGLAAVWCSWMPGAWDWAWQAALPALAGLLCGWILAGPKWGRAWLASLPAGLFLWGLSLRSGVLTWMLNEAFPGYGRMSAGGSFGVMIVTMAYGVTAGAVGPMTAWAVSCWRAWRTGKKGADGT